jgi:hypothetical protein
MFAVGLIAYRRRTSHQMGRLGAIQLAFAAGLVWPLLAVAGIQAAALLILKAAFGSVRSLSSIASGSAESPPLASVAAAVSLPVTAAAAA